MTKTTPHELGFPIPQAYIADEIPALVEELFEYQVPEPKAFQLKYERRKKFRHDQLQLLQIVI